MVFFLRRLVQVDICGGVYFYEDFTTKLTFTFTLSSQTDAGSAGEQPASNKVDAITISVGVEFINPYLLYRVAVWL